MSQQIVVLISGNGSNLQALIDKCGSEYLPDSEIALVVSNRKEAFGLTRAEKADIPTHYFPLKPYISAGKTREDYDSDLAQVILEKVPDIKIVILAGWMHILSSNFIQHFEKKKIPIINLHPALPGEFDGAHAIERAFKAYQEGKIQNTGVMVHKVIPEVDRGEVVVSRPVPIFKEDTLETLEERIHTLEHKIIVFGAALVLKLNNPKEPSWDLDRI